MLIHSYFLHYRLIREAIIAVATVGPHCCSAI